MMTPRTRRLLYGLLGIAGLACIGLAYTQQTYSRLVAAGNQAVVEQRFDSQDYERASRFWWASQDTLLFNQGVLAYKAQNLRRAAEHFRQVSQHSTSAARRTRALYNLGTVLLALKEAEGAAELFKEALRLDPQDKGTKLQLERLYHVVLRQQGRSGQAALQQAPGAGPEAEQGQQQGMGQGQSTPHKGI